MTESILTRIAQAHQLVRDRGLDSPELAALLAENRDHPEFLALKAVVELEKNKRTTPPPPKPSPDSKRLVRALAAALVLLVILVGGALWLACTALSNNALEKKAHAAAEAQRRAEKERADAEAAQRRAEKERADAEHNKREALTRYVLVFATNPAVARLTRELQDWKDDGGRDIRSLTFTLTADDKQLIDVLPDLLEPLTDAFIKMLQKEEPAAQMTAAYALRSLKLSADQQRQALPRLAALLNSPRVDVRRAAYVALGNIGKTAVPEVVKVWDTGQRKSDAIFTLGLIGQKEGALDDRYIQRIVETLAEQQADAPAQRLAAAYALSKIDLSDLTRGGRGKNLQVLLVNLLKDQSLDPPLRDECVEVLGRVGGNSQDAFEILLGFMLGKDATTSRRAAAALGELGGNTTAKDLRDQFRARLLMFLKPEEKPKTSNNVRANAIVALAGMPAGDEEVVKILTTLLKNNKDFAVRAAVQGYFKKAAEDPDRAEKLLGVNGFLTADKKKMVNNRYCVYFPVKMAVGHVYRIDLNSKAFDAYLYLEKEEGGAILERDDDSGGGLNARIYYSPPENGTYYLRATTFSAGETGSYDLTVWEIPKKPR